jgi:hypothetical protein
MKPRKKLSELEKRLAVVEREVAALKAERGDVKRHPVKMLESVHGTFEDDKASREARCLGRRWRKSQGIG